MTTWPRRTAVCIDCRAVIAPGQRCHGGASHRVRALDEPAERDRLLTEVWGSYARRRRMRDEPTRSEGPTTGSALQRLMDGEHGEVVMGIAVGVLVAIGSIAVIFVGAAALVSLVAFAVVRSVARWWRVRRVSLLPSGALAARRRLGSGALSGVVAAGPTAPSPASGTLCSGFAIELTHGRRGEVMLHDAVGLGFDVVLDDGRRLRVPPGPMIVEAVRAPLALAAAHVDDYLGTIDPARATAQDLDPFPYDRASEWCISAGDRVEIVGPLREIVDPSAAPAGYREVAGTLLVPEGPPRLRLP